MTTIHDRAQRHDPLYDRMHELPEFGELRRRYQRFVFPATAAFMSWYLLYVLMSMWAPKFMGRELWGNINVALVFGLLQFVSTFLISYLYATYSNRNIDPLARQLEEQYVDEKAQAGGDVR